MAAAVGALTPFIGRPAHAEDTIKIGILHSLSGTMAISEAPLKDVMLMLIDKQNKKGGLLGKKLEAVVVDPGSNGPLFAEMARELISKDKVAAVFGCWTTVSRKSVLAVFKDFNSVLFYPAQYEGEESERNVFYTGAVPNQQAIPAVDFLMGQGIKRWVLEGTDYVYPRIINQILETHLKLKGMVDADISINYTPFGFSDWQARVAAIKKFGSEGIKTAVVSTISADANVPFYKEVGIQGLNATDIPVIAFSIDELYLAGGNAKVASGELVATNYVESIDTAVNREFVNAWKSFIQDERGVTTAAMEAHFIGFNMWVSAVERAGTVEANRVIDLLPGTRVHNLSGGTAEMLANHHITKPVYIGEIRPDGQIKIVWQTEESVPGEPWSPELGGSRDLIADWVTLKCGQYDFNTRKCVRSY